MYAYVGTSVQYKLFLFLDQKLLILYIFNILIQRCYRVLNESGKYKTLQVLIMLIGDPAYNFIHVEDFGYVVSYAPRTSSGDFQTMLSVSSLYSSKSGYIPVLLILK